jgi:esterase/lipase
MSGREYAVNEAGVAALKGLSSRLQEQVSVIKNATTVLESELDSQKSGLGPHSFSIRKVIDSVNDEVSAASSPVNVLAEKVDNLADEYKDFIATDRFH